MSLSPELASLFESNRKNQQNLARAEVNLKQTKEKMSQNLHKVAERGADIRMTEVKMEELEDSSKQFARLASRSKCHCTPWWLTWLI